MAQRTSRVRDFEDKASVNRQVQSYSQGRFKTEHPVHVDYLYVLPLCSTQPATCLPRGSWCVQ